MDKRKRQCWTKRFQAAGATDRLNLEAAGLKRFPRIKVNEFYQTDAKNIYAVGDVIGFPSQPRPQASKDASPHIMPSVLKLRIRSLSLWHLPSEISTVGRARRTHQEGVPYEIGKAEYQEIARGTILGDSRVLKLIFRTDTRKLLGVCIIGEGASELIHIGQPSSR